MADPRHDAWMQKLGVKIPPRQPSVAASAPNSALTSAEATPKRSSAPAAKEKLVAPAASKEEILHCTETLCLAAAAAAQGYHTEVLSACLEFAQYAKEPIKELANKVDPDEIAMKLTEAAAQMLVPGIEVEGELLKCVVEKGVEITKTAAEQFKAKVTATGSKERNIEALRAAVDSLQAGALAAAMAVKIYVREVSDGLDAFGGRLADKAANSEALTEIEQLFLDRLNKGRQGHGEILEALGIPALARSDQIHLRLYKGLVAAFARELIKARASKDDRRVLDVEERQAKLKQEARMKAGAKTPLDPPQELVELDRAAQEMAEAAGAELESQWQKAGRDQRQ